jgi:DNA-binding GntR family transcriptional regulator
MEIISVTQSILYNLREQIISGELKPGERMNEFYLSTKLGISRPPLREAFRILENDSLVRNIPRKGTFVTELSVHNFEELSQVREMIECYAVDLLAAAGKLELPEVAKSLKITSNSLDEIRFNSTEVLGPLTIASEFHILLVAAAGNSRLAQLYASLKYNLARYQYIYFNIEGSVKHSLDDHKNIYQLLTDGQFETAKRELKKHIQYLVELVEQCLTNKQG